MVAAVRPALERFESGGVAAHIDHGLRERDGILVAFSERGGGVSRAPYASLDLAGHTGDDPALVDENRRLLLGVLGLGALVGSLVTAEQTHGDRVRAVGLADAGRGAYAAGGRARIPDADGLVTVAEDLPLMMLYADCVPVVIVSAGTRRAVCVVHAGWRGALAGLPAKALTRTALEAERDPSELLVYIGPHICAEHYEVGPGLLSRFRDEFATIAAAPAGLDLGGAVEEGLRDAGVRPENICSLGACTAEDTERFYSYRAEGRTGRHAAVAAILGLH